MNTTILFRRYSFNLIIRSFKLISLFLGVKILSKEIGISELYDSYLYHLGLANVIGLISFGPLSEVLRLELSREHNEDEQSTQLWSGMLAGTIIYLFLLIIGLFLVHDFNLYFLLVFSAFFGYISQLNIVLLNSKGISFTYEIYGVFLYLLSYSFFFFISTPIVALIYSYIFQQISMFMLTTIMNISGKHYSKMTYVLKSKEFIRLIPSYIASQSVYYLERNLLLSVDGGNSVYFYANSVKNAIQNVVQGTLQSALIKDINSADVLNLKLIRTLGFFFTVFSCLVFIVHRMQLYLYVGGVLFESDVDVVWFTDVLGRVMYSCVVVIGYILLSNIRLALGDVKAFSYVSLTVQVVVLLLLLFLNFDVLSRIIVSTLLGHIIGSLIIIISDFRGSSDRITLGMIFFGNFIALYGFYSHSSI